MSLSAFVLFMVFLPADAEAYYFTPFFHTDIQEHLESYENIDFTPNYNSDDNVLTITFGENPDMNTAERKLHLIVFRIDTGEPILDRKVTYRDGLIIPISMDVDNDPVIHFYILSKSSLGDYDIHMIFEFNLLWDSSDVRSYLIPSSVTVQEIPKSSGGCADCTAPTLGLNLNYFRVVDNGFSYNDSFIDVQKWHTPFPLITVQVGTLNTVEIIVYENGGINNMRLVQFGLGATEIGEPLNDLEVLIEVYLETFGTNEDITVKDIIIRDKDNLIETSTVSAISDVVECTVDSTNMVCVKVILQYSYREPTLYNIMVVNVMDKPRNSQNFWFNEGIQVVGESLNESPTYTIQNRQTKQQNTDLTLTLTRTDKINHIWTDKYDIEYLQVSQDRYDRLTPYIPIKCNDKPLDEINVPTRNNCNFRAQTELFK